MRSNGAFAPRFLALAGLLSVLALLSPAGAGAGSLVRMAHYEGAVSGGGTVSFYTSLNGDHVSSFRADHIPGTLCEVEYAEATLPTGEGFPIEHESFESLPLDFQFSFQGAFTAYQQASGTLSIIGGGCVTGTKSWTAATTEGPPKGPAVSLAYRHVQPGLRKRAITLEVGCPYQDCRVNADAHLTLGNNEFHELGSKRVLLSAGETVALTFKLKESAVAAIRKAHRQGRRRVRASMHVDCLNFEELMSTDRRFTIWVK